MKIIAKTGTGFLFEGDQTELALLMGYASQYDDDFGKRSLGIGNEIQVKDFARAARFIRTMDKDKITDLKARLAETAKKLDEASEMINALTLFDTLGDEKL